VTFYGGVHEIGGNKILLQDRDTRVFFDFGFSFAKEEKYFSGFLCPRAVNKAGDHLELGLIPKLKGLYAKDALQGTKIQYQEPEIDGLVLSHAHFDHVGHLNFVDEKIPVYCGEGTKVILSAVEESSQSRLGEHEYRTFRTGETIRVGSVEILPIHVDHSIPAAYGFVICTSEGTIAYSGDLRVHGPLASMTRDFVDKARESDVQLMISEGTRVAPRESHAIHSEARVKEESSRIVANASKLVVASFYSRDVDRFKTFYDVAQENDRKLVIPIKLAYLLHRLHDDPHLDLPDAMSDETIVLYKKRKRSGQYRATDYYGWERPFLDKAEDFRYLRKNQSKAIFNLDLTGFTELIDIQPAAGGEFIHSMSEPFSEEDIKPKVLSNWLNHFGLRFNQVHASGHCSSGDLSQLLARIHPKMIVPIHTEYPQLFKARFKKHQVQLVQEGEALQL
jgi:ribonuclease J